MFKISAISTRVDRTFDRDLTAAMASDFSCLTTLTLKKVMSTDLRLIQNVII